MPGFETVRTSLDAEIKDAQSAVLDTAPVNDNLPQLAPPAATSADDDADEGGGRPLDYRPGA